MGSLGSNRHAQRRCNLCASLLASSSHHDPGRAVVQLAPKTQNRNAAGTTLTLELCHSCQIFAPSPDVSSCRWCSWRSWLGDWRADNDRRRQSGHPEAQPPGDSNNEKGNNMPRMLPGTMQAAPISATVLSQLPCVCRLVQGPRTCFARKEAQGTPPALCNTRGGNAGTAAWLHAQVQ